MDEPMIKRASWETMSKQLIEAQIRNTVLEEKLKEVRNHLLWQEKVGSEDAIEKVLALPIWTKPKSVHEHLTWDYNNVAAYIRKHIEDLKIP